MRRAIMSMRPQSDFVIEWRNSFQPYAHDVREAFGDGFAPVVNMHINEFYLPFYPTILHSLSFAAKAPHRMGSALRYSESLWERLRQGLQEGDKRPNSTYHVHLKTCQRPQSMADLDHTHEHGS